MKTKHFCNGTPTFLALGLWLVAASAGHGQGTTFTYQGRPDDGYGPMAQDFKAAFYPGRDDTSISTLEFDGVALAAIQGLNEKVESEKRKPSLKNWRRRTWS